MISGGQFNSTLGHHVTINLNRELGVTIPFTALIHFCFQKGAREDLLESSQAKYYSNPLLNQFVNDSALLGDTHASSYNSTGTITYLHCGCQIPHLYVHHYILRYVS